MRKVEAPIERVGVNAYVVPPATPESDGMLEWSSTTLVRVDVRAGGVEAIGFATAVLVRDTLAHVVIGRGRPVKHSRKCIAA